jgi:hypothetical protein
MKVRMADLWKPVKGVTIKEVPTGKFLFHFAHPLDMEAVLNGGPWSFDNNTLILEQVQLGMQIEHIPLHFVHMWVQVHDLPTGLMKERVGIRLANYIGSFLEYDKNNNSSFWRQYMRIRVRIDVRLPLKKDTKVMNKEGQWCTVKFKYEKLGIFCFVCGIMGHAENKCEVRYSMEQDDGVRGWSAEIRADTRRQGGRLVSRWLREERGGRSEVGESEIAGQSRQAASNAGVVPTRAEVASSNQSHSQNSQIPTHTPIMTPFTTQAHTFTPPKNSQKESSSLTISGASITPTAIIPKTKTFTSLLPLPANNTLIAPLFPSTNMPAVFPNSNSTLIANQDFPITIHYKKYHFLQRQMLLPKTQSCCKKCFSQRKNCCCMSLA